MMGYSTKTFHNNKIKEEGSRFIGLSVILINSVLRTGWKLVSSSVLRRM